LRDIDLEESPLSSTLALPTSQRGDRFRTNVEIASEDEFLNFRNKLNEKEQEIRRARHEARRSFRHSEDFLGVQGINPRTGRRDISEETSITEPSSASEEMKLKMDQHVREINRLQRAYETAQAKFNADWARYRDSKAKKKKRRRVPVKEARWQLSETGWNSVFTPNLTPIRASPAEPTVRADYFGGSLRTGVPKLLYGTPSNYHSVRRRFTLPMRRRRRHRRSFK